MSLLKVTKAPFYYTQGLINKLSYFCCCSLAGLCLLTAVTSFLTSENKCPSWLLMKFVLSSFKLGKQISLDENHYIINEMCLPGNNYLFKMEDLTSIRYALIKVTKSIVNN